MTRTDAHEFKARAYGRRLAAILAIAAGLRCGLVLYANARPERFDFPDAQRYVRVALNIAAGRGPIDVHDGRLTYSGTDPLFPALLSLGMRLGLDETESLMSFGRWLNAALGVLNVFLLAWLTRRMIGTTAALFAAAILTFDPMLLYFNALVLSETPYITLLLAGFAAFWHVKSRMPFLAVSVAGLCMGLATLARSTNLFLPFALVPFIWSFARPDAPPERGESSQPRSPQPAVTGGPDDSTVDTAPKKTHAAASGANGPSFYVLAGWFLVVVAVVLVPAAVRNYRLLGHPLPIRTGGGPSLLEGLGPWADGGPGMDRIVYPDFPAAANEVERDAVCRHEALKWAAQHPYEALRLGGAKLRRTWSIAPNAEGYSSSGLAVVAWLSVAPELLLAIGGIWVLRRRFKLVVWLLLPALYFSVVHMVFVGSIRYRLPAMPLLFILAATALQAAVSSRRRET